MSIIYIMSTNIKTPGIILLSGIKYAKLCALVNDRLILSRNCIKVQVHDQIAFAKDCMPGNHLYLICGCYWSISHGMCLSLNKGLPL